VTQLLSTDEMPRKIDTIPRVLAASALSFPLAAITDGFFLSHGNVLTPGMRSWMFLNTLFPTNQWVSPFFLAMPVVDALCYFLILMFVLTLAPKFFKSPRRVSDQ